MMKNIYSHKLCAMLKHIEITRLLEEEAALNLQESYDNSGWQVGVSTDECKGVLLTLDCTEKVVDEALENGANLIIAHHPLIFGGLKRICDENYVQRITRKLIKNNISLYAAHTNYDSVAWGVNKKIADKLGLQNTRVLSEKKSLLLKLVSFVPKTHAEKVREALSAAGAGAIGNYDSCTFSSEGEGSFRALEGSKPFVGNKDELHLEKEIRIETILPAFKKNKVLKALFDSHPYEEVAYDLYELKNTSGFYGSGMIGELENEMRTGDFLSSLKDLFKIGAIRHTNFTTKTVKKVAFCGGSGSFLLEDAKAQEADVFISGDFKYHQFFDADNKIVILDIGHYESEQFTPELFYDVIRKKFPTFALHLSKVNTNPINYF